MPGPGLRDTDADGSRVTRRRLLAGAGALAAAAVAGCPSAETRNQVIDSSDVFGHAFPYDPESADLNPWPGTAYPAQFYTLVFEGKSVEMPGEGHRPADLVESVTVDGSTVDVTYDDSFRWWNGEPVTAGDQLVYERIQSAVDDLERPDVDQLDEYTLRYEFDHSVARPVALNHTVDEALITADWLFGRWVDEFDDAGTTEARDAVRDDLHEWQVTLETAKEEGFGTGPYRLEEVSLNRVMLERFDDHPRADDVDVPRLWFPVLHDLSRDKLVQSGDIDGGTGLLERMRGDVPEYIDQFDSYQTTNGRKLVLNWRHRHLARREVRRAILAAVSLEEAVRIGRFGDPKTVQTGLAEPAERRWLADDAVTSLSDHAVEADTDRAAELMRSAGYVRDDSGDWRLDGDAVSFRFRTPMFQHFRSVADYVASSLRSFGFDVDLLEVPDTRLLSDVDARNFDLLLWYSDARPYQVFDLSNDAAATLGYGTTDPSVESTRMGKPVEVTIPSGDGERTVNLVTLSNRLRRGEDVDATVETFVRWWNHAVPDVQLATQVTGIWGNTRDFAWPDADGSTYRAAGPANRPEYRLLKQGRIAGRDAPATDSSSRVD